MAITQFQDTENLANELVEFVKAVETLRLSYEQYFIGLVKQEPLQKREKVLALVRKFSGVHIQNAGLKFKLQQTVAKYNTYTVYWDRTLKEIEEGRYKRDVFRANLKGGKPTSSQKTSLSPKGKDPIISLFQEYVSVRKKCNENVSSLSLNSFRKSMDKQMQSLKKKAKGVNIRFQVVTEAGKAKIKAVTQKPLK